MPSEGTESMSMNHEHTHEHGVAHEHEPAAEANPAAFWEEMYAGSEPVWSGRVNETLAQIVADLTPGNSLDLGCGEGGDVLWLAERGWEAAGIDLSETAIRRAQAEAADRGFTHARFYAADLSQWADRPDALGGPIGPFELITASFFQSPLKLQRARILRAALTRIAAGGHLVLVSHAPPREDASVAPSHFVTPEEELEVLGLDPNAWRVLVSEVRGRSAEYNGETHALDDAVTVVQRIG